MKLKGTIRWFDSLTGEGQGPWKAIDVHGDGWLFNIVATVPGFVGEVPAQVGGSSSDEATANANLIAAAPELLAAVKALEHAIGMGIDADPELYRQAHKLAAQAIAKAEGQ